MKNPIHILALTPVRNDAEMIPGYLRNIFQLADGAILLDDGSTDESKKLLRHPKIIDVISKQHSVWNDLYNRKILLAAAYEYHPTWIIWIDIDERLIVDDITRFKIELAKTRASIISFQLYHCWNSEKYYRTDYPFSNNGMQMKRRMFKNTEPLTLLSEQSLHFDLIPIRGTEWNSHLRIKHLGNISRKRRLMRYRRYIQLDPNGSQNSIGYQHLLDKHVEVSPFL